MWGERRSKMRNPTIMIILMLTFSLSFIACSGSSDGEPSILTAAPLQEEMSFSYKETTEYQGKTMEKTVDIRFVKKDNGMFDSIKTTTDKNGPYEGDPLEVSGFFKYNKIMDYLAPGGPLWRDPKALASGNIGTMKIVEDTFNNKSVYACLQGENHTQYYNMDGFFEGSYRDTGKVKQTVVRLE